jgi:uncharacterized membrane protein
MGTTTNGYRLVLLLHIFAAIVGFGTVFLNGLYGLAAKRRRGAEGLAISEEVMHVGHIAEYFIYAVPVLGLALVGMSDKVFKFSQTWVWLSLVLYVVALGVSTGAHLPNLRRMTALQAELVAMGPPPQGSGGGPPAQALELEERGKRAAQLGGFLNLMVLALLYLMVFKPGGPRI